MWLSIYYRVMNSHNYLSTSATTFEVVLALRKLDSATLTELSSYLEIPKSTAHRHLMTLTEYDFVSVDEGEYHLGFRFLELGEYTRSRKEAYRLAKPPVSDLARETGERAQFVVEEHGMGVYLHIDTGEHAVRTGLEIGHRIHLHSTAAGKVILAHLPKSRIEEIIDIHGLPAKTPQTIIDRDELFDQLAEIKERGYAFNDKENIKGLRAVAGPVTTNDGDLLGVLSVSGPSNRMKGTWLREEIPDLILGSANELELRIEYA
jgi:DNA-binding IclR family transcriptional regulator